MYTYLDYYRDRNQIMLLETEKEHEEHKDHCIEILRQSLMCRADLNVYIYHWASSFDAPVANLNSRHRCVDWGALNDWVAKHVNKEPRQSKPAGAEVWS